MLVAAGRAQGGPSPIYAPQARGIAGLRSPTASNGSADAKASLFPSLPAYRQVRLCYAMLRRDWIGLARLLLKRARRCAR